MPDTPNYKNYERHLAYMEAMNGKEFFNPQIRYYYPDWSCSFVSQIWEDQKYCWLHWKNKFNHNRNNYCLEHPDKSYRLTCRWGYNPNCCYDLERYNKFLDKAN